MFHLKDALPKATAAYTRDQHQSNSQQDRLQAQIAHSQEQSQHQNQSDQMTINLNRIQVGDAWSNFLGPAGSSVLDDSDEEDNKRTKKEKNEDDEEDDEEETKAIFGAFPSWDNFCVRTCEICGRMIKSTVFEWHFRTKHRDHSKDLQGTANKLITLKQQQHLQQPSETITDDQRHHNHRHHHHKNHQGPSPSVKDVVEPSSSSKLLTEYKSHASASPTPAVAAAESLGALSLSSDSSRKLPPLKSKVTKSSHDSKPKRTVTSTTISEYSYRDLEANRSPEPYVHMIEERLKEELEKLGKEGKKSKKTKKHTDSPAIEEESSKAEQRLQGEKVCGSFTADNDPIGKHLEKWTPSEKSDSQEVLRQKSVKSSTLAKKASSRSSTLISSASDSSSDSETSSTSSSVHSSFSSTSRTSSSGSSSLDPFKRRRPAPGTVNKQGPEAQSQSPSQKISTMHPPIRSDTFEAPQESGFPASSLPVAGASISLPSAQKLTTNSESKSKPTKSETFVSISAENLAIVSAPEAIGSSTTSTNAESLPQSKLITSTTSSLMQSPSLLPTSIKSICTSTIHPSPSPRKSPIHSSTPDLGKHSSNEAKPSLTTTVELVTEPYSDSENEEALAHSSRKPISISSQSIDAPFAVVSSESISPTKSSSSATTTIENQRPISISQDVHSRISSSVTSSPSIGRIAGISTTASKSGTTKETLSTASKFKENLRLNDLLDSTTSSFTPTSSSLISTLAQRENSHHSLSTQGIKVEPLLLNGELTPSQQGISQIRSATTMPSTVSASQDNSISRSMTAASIDVSNAQIKKESRENDFTLPLIPAPPEPDSESMSSLASVSTQQSQYDSPLSKKIASYASKRCLPCKDREYDPDMHCGVFTPGTMTKPCTRSLTCKSHSLTARRQVQGRSKPFDELLLEHKAAKDAEDRAKGKEVKPTKKELLKKQREEQQRQQNESLASKAMAVPISKPPVNQQLSIITSRATSPLPSAPPSAGSLLMTTSPLVDRSNSLNGTKPSSVLSLKIPPPPPPPKMPSAKDLSEVRDMEDFEEEKTKSAAYVDPYHESYAEKRGLNRALTPQPIRDSTTRQQPRPLALSTWGMRNQLVCRSIVCLDHRDYCKKATSPTSSLFPGLMLSSPGGGTGDSPSLKAGGSDPKNIQGAGGAPKTVAPTNASENGFVMVRRRDRRTDLTHSVWSTAFHANVKLLSVSKLNSAKVPPPPPDFLPISFVSENLKSATPPKKNTHLNSPPEITLKEESEHVLNSHSSLTFNSNNSTKSGGTKSTKSRPKKRKQAAPANNGSINLPTSEDEGSSPKRIHVDMSPQAFQMTFPVPATPLYFTNVNGLHPKFASNILPIQNMGRQLFH